MRKQKLKVKNIQLMNYVVYMKCQGLVIINGLKEKEN